MRLAYEDMILLLYVPIPRLTLELVTGKKDYISIRRMGKPESWEK